MTGSASACRWQPGRCGTADLGSAGPRIATKFPESVHAAIAKLLAEWREPANVDPQRDGEPR